MPQPLSQFDPKARIAIGSSLASNGIRNPYLAGIEPLGLAAMEAITAWAGVERQIVTLFSHMCGGPNQDAFAVYTALKGDGPRTAALLAIIERKLLDERDRDIFHVVRGFSKACENQRNHLVHHTWGRFHDRNDAILLVDPMDLINRDGALDLSKVKVWTKPELTKLAQNCFDLRIYYDLISDLRKPQQRDEIYALLMKRPEIEARMHHHLARKAKILGEGSPQSPKPEIE